MSLLFTFFVKSLSIFIIESSGGFTGGATGGPPTLGRGKI